jgi:hypothetical protein
MSAGTFVNDGGLSTGAVVVLEVGSVVVVLVLVESVVVVVVVTGSVVVVLLESVAGSVVVVLLASVELGSGALNWSVGTAKTKPACPIPLANQPAPPSARNRTPKSSRRT